MRDITDLRITQTRLYKVDDIPFYELLLDKNLNKISESYKFKSFKPSAEGTQQTLSLTFNLGEFNLKGKSFLIEKLILESRRIIFILFGESEIGHALFGEIKKLLAEFNVEKKFVIKEPLIFTEETGCSVTLDVDFKNIFSKKLISFLNSTVKESTKSDYAKNLIYLNKFSAEITYQMNPELGNKYGVSIRNKKFTIEPRFDTPLEEKRYFTLSPTNSKTHLKLIEEFEKIFKK